MALEKPPLDAALVNEERKLQSPWFEYFEKQINDIDSIAEFEINGKTDAVITASDEIGFADVSDSNTIKKDTVQGILDLVTNPDNVQSVNLTAASSSTATTWTDVPSLSVNITPEATDSKVLVEAVLYISQTSGIYTTGFRLNRDGTDLGLGDEAGSRTRVTAALTTTTSDADFVCITMKYLDSPSTTSSTNYKVQFNNLNSGTTYFNRTITDSNLAMYPRTISTLTVTEIKA